MTLSRFASFFSINQKTLEAKKLNNGSVRRMFSRKKPFDAAVAILFF
jgi:hypothetical protein